MPQNLRKLGHTNIELSPIGLGAWQFAHFHFGPFNTWQRVDSGVIDAIILAALQHGVNWFDTAELYGFGRSERALAVGLQRAGVSGESFHIATKWSPLLRTARSIRRTIDRRLSALSPYSIDLHQIHFPGAIDSLDAQMDAMADLVNAGKIRSVGVSNFSAKNMIRAHNRLAQHGLFLASNQVRYSLLDRHIETNGVLQSARELGITIIAYSPLEQGLLTGKFHENPDLLNSRPRNRRENLRSKLKASQPLITAMKEVAHSHSVSVAQVALNWIIQVPGEHVVAIPGATKVQHAEDSAGAMAFELSRAEWDHLDEQAKRVGN